MLLSRMPDRQWDDLRFGRLRRPFRAHLMDFRSRGEGEAGAPAERYVFRFSAKSADQGLRGEPKRSRTRRRNWRKLTMPKARHRTARRPWLKPSALPLLDRQTK